MQSFHQCDLFDLQTTRSINDFFPPPILVLSSFSPANLHNSSFSQPCLLSLIIPHNLLSPCFFPSSSSLSSLHVNFFFFFLSHWSLSLLISLLTSSLPLSLIPFPSLSASLAGCSLQWVSIMEAGSGAAAAVGSAALGLLGATATSSHDILDR